MLKEKQKIVFKRIEAHYNNILEGKQTEPSKTIVMGTAETGKFTLSKEYEEDYVKWLELDLKHRSSPCTDGSRSI